jgi:hypothetical protein
MKNLIFLEKLKWFFIACSNQSHYWKLLRLKEKHNIKKRKIKKKNFIHKIQHPRVR